jgi:hypothetical protein
MVNLPEAPLEACMAIKRRLEGTSDDPDNFRDQGWVLKRQVFLHKAENREIENVYESRERRL